MSSKPEALIGCIRRGPERRWAGRPETALKGVGNAPHRRRSWRRGAKTGAATETSAVLGSGTTFGLSPSSSPSLLIILCIYFVDLEPVETIRELPAFEQQQYRADLTVGHSNHSSLSRAAHALFLVYFFISSPILPYRHCSLFPRDQIYSPRRPSS